MTALIVIRYIVITLGLGVLIYAIPQVVRLWSTVAAEVRFKNLALLSWVFAATEATIESLYLGIAPGPRTILTLIAMIATAFGYSMPPKYRQYPRHPRKGATVATVAMPPVEDS